VCKFPKKTEHSASKELQKVYKIEGVLGNLSLIFALNIFKNRNILQIYNFNKSKYKLLSTMITIREHATVVTSPCSNEERE